MQITFVIVKFVIVVLIEFEMKSFYYYYLITGTKARQIKSQLCQFKEMPSKFIPVTSPISILESLSHFPAKMLCRFCEVIENYKDLLEKITSCKLPLALKASVLNKLALAKILHHFYNTRFTEEQLELMVKSLVKAVRNMYDLYETTTQLIIFLPREHGWIGV